MIPGGDEERGRWRLWPWEKPKTEQGKPGHLQAGKPELFSQMQGPCSSPSNNLFPIHWQETASFKQQETACSFPVVFVWLSTFIPFLCAGAAAADQLLEAGGIWMVGRPAACVLVLLPYASHEPGLSTWGFGGIVPEWTLFSQKFPKLGDVFHRSVTEWSKSLLCRCRLETRCGCWQSTNCSEAVGSTCSVMRVSKALGDAAEVPAGWTGVRTLETMEGPSRAGVEGLFHICFGSLCNVETTLHRALFMLTF